MFPRNLRFRRFLKFTFQPAATISHRAGKRGKVTTSFKVKYWIFGAEVCYRRRRNEAHRSGQSSLSCDHVINPLVSALMPPLEHRVLPRYQWGAEACALINKHAVGGLCRNNQRHHGRRSAAGIKEPPRKSEERRFKSPEEESAAL